MAAVNQLQRQYLDFLTSVYNEVSFLFFHLIWVCYFMLVFVILHKDVIFNCFMCLYLTFWWWLVYFESLLIKVCLFWCNNKKKKIGDLWWTVSPPSEVSGRGWPKVFQGFADCLFSGCWEDSQWVGHCSVSQGVFVFFTFSYSIGLYCYIFFIMLHVYFMYIVCLNLVIFTGFYVLNELYSGQGEAGHGVVESHSHQLKGSSAR